MGEKLPAHDPCATISPASRGSMSYLFDSPNNTGAIIAVAAGPGAPADVAIDVTRNMAQGTNAALPPRIAATRLTTHWMVPVTDAMPNREVTPKTRTKRSTGKP